MCSSQCLFFFCSDLFILHGAFLLELPPLIFYASTSGHLIHRVSLYSYGRLMYLLSFGRHPSFFFSFPHAGYETSACVFDGCVAAAQ